MSNVETSRRSMQPDELQAHILGHLFRSAARHRYSIGAVANRPLLWRLAAWWPRAPTIDQRLLLRWRRRDARLVRRDAVRGGGVPLSVQGFSDRENVALNIAGCSPC